MNRHTHRPNFSPKTDKLLTFDSLMFFNIGPSTARGCRAKGKLANNALFIEVYGGMRNTGSDGATTFDARVSSKDGDTVRVPGYPPVLRQASREDVTCLMIHAQKHTRIKLHKHNKSTKIKS